MPYLEFVGQWVETGPEVSRCEQIGCDGPIRHWEAVVGCLLREYLALMPRFEESVAVQKRDCRPDLQFFTLISLSGLK